MYPPRAYKIGADTLVRPYVNCYLLYPNNLIYLLLNLVLVGGAEIDKVRLGEGKELLVEPATGVDPVAGAVGQQMRIKERFRSHRA